MDKLERILNEYAYRVQNLVGRSLSEDTDKACAEIKKLLLTEEEIINTIKEVVITIILEKSKQVDLDWHYVNLANALTEAQRRKIE